MQSSLKLIFQDYQEKILLFQNEKKRSGCTDPNSCPIGKMYHSYTCMDKWTKCYFKFVKDCDSTQQCGIK